MQQKERKKADPDSSGKEGLPSKDEGNSNLKVVDASQSHGPSSTSVVARVTFLAEEWPEVSGEPVARVVS